MKFLFSSLLLLLTVLLNAQENKYLLKPDRVFDGQEMHTDWAVLVVGNKIIKAEQKGFETPSGTKVIDLEGTTLLPGLIEGHAHLFLHPYNETSWNDQVLKESRTERSLRAANHAKATLMAGFTTLRDLGTEGAAYDDIGLKTAIAKGIIVGPRVITATKAIVGEGSYGVKAESADLDLPKGAAEVGNQAEMAKEVRHQIGKGADVIKVYADYRWGPKGESAPTFTEEELATAVAIAKSSGRYVAVHSSTKEGMLRSIRAGVHTIEHGSQGDLEVFQQMKAKNIAFCPTLAAGASIMEYSGWKEGVDPDPERIVESKASFKAALASGVTILMGGDVGVFPHGDNAKEMEMMVEYGMEPLEVLRSATSVNAEVFGYGGQIGRLQPGMLADIIAVKGDPTQDIKRVRNPTLVMKDGVIYKQ